MSTRRNDGLARQKSASRELKWRTMRRRDTIEHGLGLRASRSSMRFAKWVGPPVHATAASSRADMPSIGSRSRAVAGSSASSRADVAELSRSDSRVYLVSTRDNASSATMGAMIVERPMRSRSDRAISKTELSRNAK